MTFKAKGQDLMLQSSNNAILMIEIVCPSKIISFMSVEFWNPMTHYRNTPHMTLNREGQDTKTSEDPTWRKVLHLIIFRRKNVQ